MENGNMTASPKKLVAKLAKVMGSIDWVAKRGKNSHFGYNYAQESDIMDAVREKLASEQVFVTTSVESMDLRPTGKTTRDGANIFLTLAKTKHTFHDGETGESIEVFGFGCGEDSGDKGIYKATTGAMKYFVSKNFLMSTGDDPENDADEKPERPASRPAQEDRGPTPPVYPRQDFNPPPLEPPALRQEYAAPDRTFSPDSVVGERDIVDDAVMDVQSKTGPKKDGSTYTRYSIQTKDNGYFTTFNAAYADLAQDAQRTGQLVTIRYKANGRWKDILSIRYAETAQARNGYSQAFAAEEPGLPF